MSWLTKAADFLAPGWVGSIIGIASVVIALIVYFKSRQRTNFSYSYRGDRLLGTATDGLPAEITVQFRGENIPRLTRSLVVFWNSGDKTLLDADIVNSDPLCLAIGEDGEILSISLLKSSRDVNEISITRSPINKHEAYLHFAFLDSRDGAVVEILHTSETRTPSLTGTLRGLPKGMKNLGKIAYKAKSKLPAPFRLPFRVMAWITTILGGLIMLAGLFLPIEEIDKALILGSEMGTSVITATGALYLCLGLALMFTARRKYPRELQTDDLE